MKKKILICELNTVEQLEEYFRSQDTHFRYFVDRDVANELLIKTKYIAKKPLLRWFQHNISKVASLFVRQFWLNRGYSNEEAIIKISEIQSKNSKLYGAKIKRMKNTGDENWKKMFNTKPEYYEARGSTKDEAAALVHERQITFSLQKCIARYGEVEGTHIWGERQAKWINTLASKTDAEKLEIKRKKVVPMSRASRESLRIFIPLHEMLVSKGICKDSEVYYGFEKRKEYYLADNENFFCYDFCIPKLKLIIEYQGKVWHPDYRLEENLLLSWKNAQGVAADKIIAGDITKRKFAEQKGYQVGYVWGSDDVKQQMEEAFKIVVSAVEKNEFDIQISNIETLLQTTNVSISSPYGFNNVIEFFVKKDKNLFELLFSDGRRLKCSDDHFILTTTGHWVSIGNLAAAKDITYDNMFFETDTGRRKIISIVKIGVGTVNDLTVEHKEHCYYANGIVSHNTGKTLLTLATGMQLTLEGSSKYDRLIISRPVQPVGKDIGFLPGTLQEKMDPWIAPIKDNLDHLCRNKRTRRDEPYLDLLLRNKKIEIEAITYIRGRSIPDAYLIIDEAQNLSLHELKTIITRVGDGTKIVLTGDIEQIDNNHVDIYSNGLTNAIEAFKEYKISGHITLIKGERSALATLASKIL